MVERTTRPQSGQSWTIDPDGNIQLDKVGMAKPLEKIPEGLLKGFDNPLPPINTPNKSAKDLVAGSKKFDFATPADVTDLRTVLQIKSGAQIRTGSGFTENDFNQQYNPDDPNAFGYQTRFLFMKDPVNHYTEAPGFVTEEQGMVYTKNYLDVHNRGGQNIPSYIINPKKSIPTKNPGDFTTNDVIPGDEGLFGYVSPKDQPKNQMSLQGTETPKDKDSLGDEYKKYARKFDETIETEKNPMPWPKNMPPFEPRGTGSDLKKMKDRIPKDGEK